MLSGAQWSERSDSFLYKASLDSDTFNAESKMEASLCTKLWNREGIYPSRYSKNEDKV